LEHALRLDPRNEGTVLELHMIATGYYHCRDYAAAATVAKRATRAFPDGPLSYRLLAAALGQLGRVAEAKEALDKAIELSPTGLDAFVRTRPAFAQPDDYAHLLEGYRKAGWLG